MTTTRDRLDDAQAEYDRYMGMLAALGAGVVVGILMFIAAGVLSAVFDWSAGEVMAVWIPGLILMVACGAAFAVRVVVAYEDDDDHPARALRRARRAHRGPDDG